jgi:hypothetical protein
MVYFLMCSFYSVLVQIQLVYGVLWESVSSVPFVEGGWASLVNRYENNLHKGYKTREDAQEAY